MSPTSLTRLSYAAAATCIATAIIYFPVQSATSTYATKVYLVLLAAVTVVWCTSMVLLFADIFFVKHWFPERFEEHRRVPFGFLALCSVIGMAVDAVAVVLLFMAPWSPIFTKSGWDLAVAAITLGSIGIGLAIYFISETRQREAPPQGVPAVAGGSE